EAVDRVQRGIPERHERALSRDAAHGHARGPAARRGGDIPLRRDVADVVNALAQAAEGEPAGGVGGGPGFAGVVNAVAVGVEVDGYAGQPALAPVLLAGGVGVVEHVADNRAGGGERGADGVAALAGAGAAAGEGAGVVARGVGGADDGVERPA